MGRNYIKRTILYKRETTQEKTIQRKIILYKRETIQKKNYMEGDYTGRNCTEKGLHYSYIGKKTIQRRDYTKKQYKGKDYIRETIIQKRGITRGRDCMEKDYTERTTLNKKKTTQERDYTRRDYTT